MKKYQNENGADKKERRILRKKTPVTAPELYSEEEINLLEAHINEHFGNFDNVFHEIVSPDIHVDIAVIPPAEGRDFYTLMTMGMGAHLMKVPKELDKYRLRRAEVMICLPSDWQYQSDDEQWYWPLRWLKILARLPINNDTWLGYGHSVPNGEPFAGNTRLSGVILSDLIDFGEDSRSLEMPDGSRIVFYQVIPTYDEEMSFKLENGAEAILALIAPATGVVNINRPSGIVMH